LRAGNDSRILQNSSERVGGKSSGKHSIIKTLTR
jgi:hypothetical protein